MKGLKLILLSLIVVLSFDNTANAQIQDRHNDQCFFCLRERNKSSYIGHWVGFYLGFANSSTKYPTNLYRNNNDFMDLDWGRSLVMHFNFSQVDISLSSDNSYGFTTGLGLEYERLMFNNPSTHIYVEDDVLKYGTFNHKGIVRNSLKNLFLTLPLLFEKQFELPHGNRAYVTAGFIGGIRLHSKTKLVYREDGEKHKIKDKNNFMQNALKFDGFLQIGINGYQIWCSTNIAPIFKKSKGPEMSLFTLGISISTWYDLL